MNFGEHLSKAFEIKPESALHPHSPEENASEYQAIDGGSAELEVLTFLNALVYLFKPAKLLETGTGLGFTSIALAEALGANGKGHLNTVELESNTVARARANMLTFDASLTNLITYNTGDSRAFIADWNGPPFDFVLFDSLIEFRHLEFEDLLDRNMLTPTALCAFHDTSRLRGEYYADYNPQMIAALDKASHGRQWLECPFSRGFRLLKLG